MTFLSPILLAFLGAAVVPLVLHLLSRSRQSALRWGAMMFLAEESPRRSLLRRLSYAGLLGLRCGAIALLALALARPTLGLGAGGGGGGSLPGRAPAWVAVVVDTSASTGVSIGGGAASGQSASRLDLIKDAVTRLLAGLPAADQVALLTGDAGASSFTADRSELAARLSALTVTATRLDVARELSAAVELLSHRPLPGPRFVFVVTDRQASSYLNVTDRFAGDFARQRQAAGGVRVVFVPVGPDDPDNVAVTDLRLEGGRAAVRGLPATLLVDVRNDGHTPRTGWPVRLSQPGSGLPEQQRAVNLAPGATATVAFPVTFSRPGRVLVSAYCPPAGAPLDDRYDGVIRVREPMAVLVVSDAPTSSVATALAPYAAARARGVHDLPETAVDPAVVTVVSPGRFPAFSLDEYRLVVIPGFAGMSDVDRAALRQYVYAGGGLLVGLAANAEPATLEDLASLLPATLDERAPAATRPVRVIAPDPSHPALRPGAESADIASLEPATPVRLRVNQNGKTLLSADGAPWLVAGDYGSGRVVLAGSPLEGSPVDHSPGYLPLVQLLAAYLRGGDDGESSFIAGPETSVSVRLPDDADLRNVRLELPDRVRVSPAVERVAGRAVASWGPARLAGVYRFQYRVAGRVVVDPVVVRLPRAEFDLDGSPALLRRAAGLCDAVVLGDGVSAGSAVQGVAELPQAVGVLRSGRELWPVLLAVGLAVLLAEQLVVWSWGRVR